MKIDYTLERGKLIALEGIDGSGKTSLAEHLANYLKSRGLNVKRVSRYLIPELTKLWHQLITEKSVNQQGAAMLAAADYFIGLERCIRPALSEREIVLTDRYFYSHLVHFALRGISLDQLQKIFQEALIPDLVFYIDVSVETAFERLQPQKKPDFWECGLDYRLGVDIGQAYYIYERQKLSDEVMRRHFIEHQSDALKLFPQLLPGQKTCYLDGHLNQTKLLEQCILELDKLAG